MDRLGVDLGSGYASSIFDQHDVHAPFRADYGPMDDPNAHTPLPTVEKPEAADSLNQFFDDSFFFSHVIAQHPVPSLR